MLLTVAILVRLLDGASYGVLAFGFSVVALAAALVGLGLGPAVTRGVAEHSASGDRAGVSAIARGLEAWVAVGGVVGLLVLVAVMATTQSELPLEDRVVIGVGLGALLIGRISAVAATSFALGAGRLMLMDVSSLAANLLQLLIALLLLAGSVTSVDVVSGAFGVSGLVSAAIAYWVVRRISRPDEIGKRAYRTRVGQLARLAAPFALAGVMIQVIANFDVFVLGLTHPSQVVGGYEPIALGVARLTSFVAAFLMAGYLPAATRLMSDGHREAFAELYLGVSKIRYIVSWPVIVILAVAPGEVFHFLFGSAFVVSTTIVRVLLIGFIFDLVFGLNGQALVASGERRRMVIATIWPLAAMLLLSLVLIPTYGPLGAAWATTGALIVLNLSMTQALHTVAGVSLFDRRLALAIITSPMALLIAWALVGPASGLPASVAYVAAGWFIWILALRFLAVVDRGDLARLLPYRRRA
jgi:O-antigen/teichoic acid export membrane protein